MSSTTTANAYGIGIMTMIVGLTAVVVFYQSFYLPESLLKPSVDEHILNPTRILQISIIQGSSSPDQQDNYQPKVVGIQLGIDNHVIWINDDDTAHTVTPDHPVADAYSGEFGSIGVIRVGETYEFLFTDSVTIPYHCTPHPWMTGMLDVTKQRF